MAEDPSATGLNKNIRKGKRGNKQKANYFYKYQSPEMWVYDENKIDLMEDEA